MQENLFALVEYEIHVRSVGKRPAVGLTSRNVQITNIKKQIPKTERGGDHLTFLCGLYEMILFWLKILDWNGSEGVTEWTQKENRCKQK